ncbi:MAG: hypothetical protein LBD11_07010 [Candidatus Peribacteria bacterium]|nr:hypothetical protein [Candidatus Peribacteria bacterium]
MNLGDTIRPMYITIEGMSNAGISTVAEKLDIEEMQQQQERAMERQASQRMSEGGSSSVVVRKPANF